MPQSARLSRVYDTARCGTEGAGYGDIGIKQAIEEEPFPPARVRRNAWISTTALQTWKLRSRTRDAESVQIVDGPVEARKAAREQLEHGATG